MSQSITDARLFDADELTGITEYFYSSDDGESFMIETRQDVGPLIELNKALANDAPLRWGEFSHVASIPAVIMMELAKQKIVTPAGVILDEPALRRFLNDRDNQFFRTRPGTL